MITNTGEVFLASGEVFANSGDVIANSGKLHAVDWGNGSME